MITLFFKILFLFFLLAGSLFLTTPSEAFVKDPIYDELEGVELIQSLLKDGKWDLAQTEIQGLAVNNPKLSQYYLAQWHYLKGEFEKSLPLFLSLDTNIVKDVDLWRLRTHAHLKNNEKCLAALNHFYEHPSVTENDYLLRAQCALRLKRYEVSWETLSKARQRYKSYTVEREWVQLQLDLGLRHQAWENTLNWLVKVEAPSAHSLHFAELFQSQGAVAEAQKILELARLRHPLNMDINLAFSQIYFHKGMMMVAEEGFSRAAHVDAKYFYHTAELNRQSGRYERSLFFNSHVQNEKERLKQKIATYVDANRYALIASMDSVIQRSELARDEEILYALSYSLVRNGDRDKSLKYLAKITKPELIEKSTLLRQALLECQKKQERCDI